MHSGKEGLGGGALLTPLGKDGGGGLAQPRLSTKSQLCGLAGEGLKPML